MKYIINLFKSITEVLIVILIQYLILIGIFLLFGNTNSIIIGTICLMIFELGYIIYKYRKNNIIIGGNNYFSYILLGVSISVIYNMIIFKYGISFTPSDINIVINIMASCIIGPIFEEFLFRYTLINKLEKFNSRFITILISSFIFAIIHTNIPTMIFAFIIGLVNSYFYINKRDLLIPICIHIFCNFISTFLYGYNIYILILGIILFIISNLIIRKRTI